jgi:hypothetical protein
MSTELPPPLVPAETDLRDFQFMPIDIVRLFNSGFHAVASDAEWRAGVTLWLKSYHQTPAGSLPDLDVELCRLAELGRDLKTWNKVKAVAMRGWVKCADGRLYHATVAEKVVEAWGKKQAKRRLSRAGNEKRWGNGVHSRPQPEPRGEDQGGERDHANDPAAIPPGQPTGVPSSIPAGPTTGVPERSRSYRKGQGQGQGEIISDHPHPTISDVVQAKTDDDEKSDKPEKWTRQRLDELEFRLREAAGLINDPSPGLVNISSICGRIDGGVSLERTILPAIRKVAAKAKEKGWKIRFWAYFHDEIDAVGKSYSDGKTAAAATLPDPPGVRRVDLGGGFSLALDADAKRVVSLWMASGWRAPSPPPGKPGCLIPDEFLPDEYRREVAA